MASPTIESDKRHSRRVAFEHGYPAHMMAIDGTWRRSCILNNVSDTGAQLTVDKSIEGLSVKEFFLLLSSTGLAYRRCELAWVNGEQLGVNFLKHKQAKDPKGSKPVGSESSGT